jgi:pilus assembly protein Flp/PilA
LISSINTFLNRPRNDPPDLALWFAQVKEIAIMLKVIRTFAKDESGATAIEYGLIAALVSVAAIGALTAMGNSLSTMFNTVSSALSTATGG